MSAYMQLPCTSFRGACTAARNEARNACLFRVPLITESMTKTFLLLFLHDKVAKRRDETVRFLNK